MARLSDTIGVLVFGVVSFSAAYWLAIFSFLIQVWREQGRTKLTGVTLAYLFLFGFHIQNGRSGPASRPVQLWQIEGSGLEALKSRQAVNNFSKATDTEACRSEGGSACWLP